MKEVMWKVDPDGDFRFSDATNPNQLVLFEADTTSTLVDQLRREFCGKGQVTGSAVRTFVENVPYVASTPNPLRSLRILI